MPWALRRLRDNTAVRIVDIDQDGYGLIASTVVTWADVYTKRKAAEAIAREARQAAVDEQTRITLDGDKGCDAQEFIKAYQTRDVGQHVAQTPRANVPLSYKKELKSHCTFKI